MDKDQHYWNVRGNVYSAPMSSVYHNSGQGPIQYSFHPPSLPVNLTQPQCEVSHHLGQRESYHYDVKIVNPSKKSDFVVRRWHDVSEAIQTPSLLKAKLQESFPQDVPTNPDFKLGYMNGNQRYWIFEDRDLQVMYKSFKPGSTITLWCEGIGEAEPSSKRRKTTSTPVSTSTSNSSSDVKENVDQIFKDLKTKHPDMEATKLRLWARLVDKGRYDDYDKPPQIPLITGSPAPAKKKSDSISNALVDAATVVAKAFQTSHATPTSPSRNTSAKENQDPPSKLSPLKYAQLRRSCLEDLKSLKDLYQEDVLSEAEFIEEKSRILSTLKTLQ